MKVFVVAALIALQVAGPLPVAIQVPATPAHVAAAQSAINSGYALNDATHDCPAVSDDMFGWPASRLERCVYRQGAHDGVVYLLKIDAKTLARWIETACSAIPTDGEACFARVLADGRNNSNFMFAIAGNILEDQNGNGVRNYFFRNGMTVSFAGHPSGSTDSLSVVDQEAIARLPNNQISSIPTGLTRPWRTTPAIFAWRYPWVGPPELLDAQESRRRWLDRVQGKMNEALYSDHNELLEAWLCAQAQADFGASCRSRRILLD